MSTCWLRGRHTSHFEIFVRLASIFFLLRHWLIARNPGEKSLHPWGLTWNIIMEVWKIIFLSKWMICRFHVNLPGCSDHASVLGVSWVGLAFQKSQTKLRTAKEPFVGDWVEKASNIKFNCVFVGVWNFILPYLTWSYIVLLVLPKTPTQRGSLRTFPGPSQSNPWRVTENRSYILCEESLLRNFEILTKNSEEEHTKRSRKTMTTYDDAKKRV